jgi:hypothetical protein
MRKLVRMLALGASATLAAACVGCSTDPIVWGSEGAEVRSITDKFIADVLAEGSSAEACSEVSLDFGAPSSWEGLAAGEPEEYAEDQWEEFAELSPTWLINLSPTDSDDAKGASEKETPAYLFYRGSGDDLCVAGIAWGSRATS